MTKIPNSKPVYDPEIRKIEIATIIVVNVLVIEYCNLVLVI